MDEKIEQLKSIIEASGRMVFFGGAGLSTESGIPDFRSASGIFTSSGVKSPEEIVSYSYFIAHPDEFFAFYREKMLYPDALPNAAHRALAYLEEQGTLRAVITQNVDGLHQAAGSRNVIELHGSVHRNYCMDCKKAYALDEVLGMPSVPHCTCGGIIRPDVVLYEESLDEDDLMQSVDLIATADTLLIGGTSLIVNPAASLIRYFHGDNLVIINMAETPTDSRADLVIHEPIGQVLSKAVDIP